MILIFVISWLAFDPQHRRAVNFAKVTTTLTRVSKKLSRTFLGVNPFGSFWATWFVRLNPAGHVTVGV